MTEDVTGTWEGKYATGTAPAYDAYGGAFDGFDLDLEIRRTSTESPQLYDAKLRIASQTDYRKYGTWTGRLVSIISGQLDYMAFDFSYPVSGFVDDTGWVKLGLAETGSRWDRTFVGRLTHRGLEREISGNVMARMAAGTSWTDRFTSYAFATLSVKNIELGVDERAYTVDYGHVF